MSMNEVVKKLSQAIDKQADKAKTTAYDTPATVRRIEGDTAWVHIPGGVDETPVKMTISAKEGDQVQVRVSGGSAFMVGNGTNPPTDDARANEAYTVATVAEGAAENALANASRAKEAADSAQASASRAESAAGDAVIAAGNAQTAAGNAQQSADSALVSLATVQDVVGVLNWITAHGTMTLTSDVTVNPAHVYFVVDPAGDYVVGGTHYSIVSEPKDAELSTYYELTVDESVQNYVATHIVVDTEGLWIIPDSGGNKVLIAVGGAGHTYSTAGTYIVGKVNDADTVLASFLENGAKIGRDNSSSITLSPSEVTGTSDDGAQFFDFEATGAQVEEYINVKYPLLKNDGVEIPIGSNEYTVIPASETDLSVIPVGQECTFRNYSTISTATKQKLTIQFLSSDSLQSHITSVVNVSAVGLSNYNVTTGAGQYVIFEYDAASVTIGTTKSQRVSFTVRLSTEAGGSTTHYADVEYKFNYSGSTNKLKRVLTITTRGSSSVRSGNVKVKANVGAGVASSMTLVYAPCSTVGNRALDDDPGAYSTAIGADLYASGDYQVATGKYNVQDTSDTYAFIIGNGTANNARSNALTVDWSGNVDIASGAKYKINGTALTASDVGATPVYHGYGTAVSIESYTTKAGAYVIPSDGIIRVQCRYTSGNYIGVTVCNSDGTNEFSIQIGSEGNSIKNTAFPVFKGMKAWRSSNNGSYNYIEFHPYI